MTYTDNTREVIAGHIFDLISLINTDDKISQDRDKLALSTITTLAGILLDDIHRIAEALEQIKVNTRNSAR